MRLLKALLVLMLMSVAWFGCKKESEMLSVASVQDYYPLQTGKSFLYRLDSTLYVAFGTTIQIKSYLAKDSVVSTFADNQGRLSYLVYRYITDTLQQQPFAYNSNYYITPTGSTIEVTDANNLRYVKLAEPITATNSWEGNLYIDAEPDKLGYLSGWTYQYKDINMPFMALAGTIDSTITVLQEDAPSTVQPFDPAQYQSSTYSSEVYAKGIGLIYKDFSYWTWQSTSSITPGYTADSYGIRLNLISHN